MMKLISKLLLTLILIVSFAPGSPSFADVNDFSFESFDATYEISVDESKENRTEMVVTEKLVALFPMVEQNRGIRRSIPLQSYQVFPGLIEIISVTDDLGQPREYESTQEEGFLNLHKS